MRIIKKYTAIWLIVVFCASGLNPPTLNGLSVSEEEEMSHQVLGMIFRYYEIIDDPYVQGYINKLGAKILAVLPEQPFKYHFYIIKEDTLNAFATPAGHIFIHSGLIAKMDTEEELAGIIGHEIAHVYCRHISQAIEHQKKAGWAQLAGMAAGLLLGMGGAGEAASAVTMGSAGAAQSSMLAYSRENELQADQFGLKFLTAADYNGYGLLEGLKKIRSTQWFGEEQIPTYLTTHPAVNDRIAYIDGWLEGHVEAEKKIPMVDPAEFDRIRTRVMVEYSDEDWVLGEFESALRKQPDNPLAHYHYGLILARTGKRDQALEELRAALGKRAFDPYILRDLGRTYFLDGQYQPALSALESAASAIPDDPDCLLFLGQTHMELGNLDESTRIFSGLVEKMPAYPKGYYFLGQSLGKQNNLGEAHYYLGIYYLKKHDGKAAADQLRRAYKHLEDPQKKKNIEEILTKMEKQKQKIEEDGG